MIEKKTIEIRVFLLQIAFSIFAVRGIYAYVYFFVQSLTAGPGLWWVLHFFFAWLIAFFFDLQLLIGAIFIRKRWGRILIIAYVSYAFLEQLATWSDSYAITQWFGSAPVMPWRHPLIGVTSLMLCVLAVALLVTMEKDNKP